MSDDIIFGSTEATRLAERTKADIPSMREVLARAACEVATAGRMPDPDWEAFLPLVDAILTELQEPSDGMIQAACDTTFGPEPLTPEEMHTMGHKAMIQHIKDGGS